MSPAPRLTQAGVLAALLSLVAVSCGSDLVDLLPPNQTAAGSSAAGMDNKGGTETEGAGAGSGGRSGEAGNTVHQGGLGGTGQTGGYAGTGGGCFGFACPGAGQTGVGGAFGNPNCNGGICTPCTNGGQCEPGQRCSRADGICVQCDAEGGCKSGYGCDLLLGRCGFTCRDTSDCENGRVCDTAQGVCVQCIDASACEKDFDAESHICYLHRCVECLVNTDCPPGERNVCTKSFQCVQLQCVSDEDCKDNPNGEDHCDVPRGRCE